MTEAPIETVDAGGGEAALATEDIGGGEVVLTTDPATAEQVNGFDVEIVDTNSPVAEGDMSIVANVTNTTPSSDTQDVVLTIDGTEEDRRSVSLAGGADDDVPLRWAQAGSNPAQFYTATVSTEDDSDSITVEVVDDPYDIREEPDLGTVLEITASISVFDNLDNNQEEREFRTLSDIDTLVFTPEFSPAGTQIFGSRRALEVRDGAQGSTAPDSETLGEILFDADGDKTGGDLTPGEEAVIDVTGANDKLALFSDDGLSSLT